ncbi:hypothetical protein U0C82_14640 [Fulvimarina sp. 2208YS6-2-32]|uniref:Uncharacterized protein n=1 Tax=Fulvimarina uroteuthidis TaxID=3098149 RepID=A0ABU5I4T2_9HYPH|nr:hypothetical protein [Fulvimarina sp. 2208YS6-2-32]MDY8110377.1 hypothetical protein [Fulvimarina sp. 2208YS6-2-32]
MANDQTRTEANILPIDQAIGGDADTQGIAQPVTQAEIDDVLNNPTLPIEERQKRLEEIRARIGSRENADRGDDMSAIEMQISEALGLLAGGGHTYATAESVGMDPASRADARSPDDDLSLGQPDAAGTREPK